MARPSTVRATLLACVAVLCAGLVPGALPSRSGPAHAAPAPPTPDTTRYFSLDSGPYESLGRDEDHVYTDTTPGAVFASSLTTSAFTMQVSGGDRPWTISLTAAAGEPLLPGFYRKVENRAGTPWMQLSSADRFCLVESGWFVIVALEREPDDSLRFFHAFYEHRCNDERGRARGEVVVDNRPIATRTADLVPDTAALDFPATPYSPGFAEQVVTVVNPNAIGVHPGSSFVTSDHFQVTDDGCAGTELAPGGSCRVTVAFATRWSGPQVGWLGIPNDAGLGVVRVDLSGAMDFGDPPSSHPFAPPRLFVADSDPDDPIGRGELAVVTDATPGATFNATLEAGQGMFTLNVGDNDGGWMVRLAAPFGRPLVPGYYPDTRRARDEIHPMLDVAGRGRGCTSSTGAFQVYALVTDDQQRIVYLHASFEHSCYDFGPSLRGEVVIDDRVLPVGSMGAPRASALGQAGETVRDLTPDGTFALVTGPDGTVRIDTSTGDRAVLLPTTHPEALLRADGGAVYFDDGGRVYEHVVGAVSAVELTQALDPALAFTLEDVNDDGSMVGVRAEQDGLSDLLVIDRWFDEVLFPLDVAGIPEPERRGADLSLSGDGWTAAFTVPGAPGCAPCRDVIVVDLLVDEAFVLDTTPAGQVSAGDSYAPVVSADGVHVSFLSDATDLGPTVPPGTHVYAVDLNTADGISLIAADVDPTLPPTLSGDGVRAGYATPGTPSPGYAVYDRVDGTTADIALAARASGPLVGVATSDDGRIVALSFTPQQQGTGTGTTSGPPVQSSLVNLGWSRGPHAVDVGAPELVNGPFSVTGTTQLPSTPVTVADLVTGSVCAVTSGEQPPHTFSCAYTPEDGQVYLFAVSTRAPGGMPLTAFLVVFADLDAPALTWRAVQWHGPEHQGLVDGSLSEWALVTVRDADGDVVCEIETDIAYGCVIDIDVTTPTQRFTVTAVDDAGNSTQIDVVFTADVAPPQPRLDAPEISTTDSTIRVRGSLDEQGSVSVRTGDDSEACRAPSFHIPDTPDGRFSFECSFAAAWFGTRPFTLVATDVFGNVAAPVALSVTRDATAIDLTGSRWAGPGYYALFASFDHAVHAVDLRDHHGNPVCNREYAGTDPSSAAYFCTFAVTYPVGAYTYRIQVTDLAGNVTSKPVPLVRRAGPPTLEARIEPDPAPVGSPLVLSGRSEPGALVTAGTLDGTTVCVVSVGTDGTFVCPPVVLPATGTGVTLVSVRADQDGLNTAASIIVRQRPMAPPPPNPLPPCTIVGTSRADVLRGTPGPDVICGLGGNDTIRGRGGDDLVIGGAGNDRLYGEAGNDIVFGDDGNDMLYGGDGNDTLLGASGKDSLYGGTGNDTAAGGDGNDTLSGGADADYLLGDAGNDTLGGSYGDDDLLGGDGSDSLSGGSGADRLRGAGADDRLYGGTGNDDLDGGDGRDLCRQDRGAGPLVFCER